MISVTLQASSLDIVSGNTDNDFCIIPGLEIETKEQYHVLGIGIKKVILPEDNKKDLSEIDKAVYAGIDLVFVKSYAQVYSEIFE